MSTTTTATPGWYTEGDHMRYWNGAEWTEDTRPAAPVVQPASEGAGALVVIGYVMACLVPFVGFVLGIIAATRPAKATSKHGAWIIVLSVVAFVVWLAIVAHSAQSTYDTTSY